MKFRSSDPSNLYKVLLLNLTEKINSFQCKKSNTKTSLIILKVERYFFVYHTMTSGFNNYYCRYKL